MLSAIVTIYNILKLIPQLKSIWDGVVKMYIENELEKMHEADRAAIKKAVEMQDQRDLEKQIGSDKPGLPSGLPGTEIKHELPNVGGPK